MECDYRHCLGGRFHREPRPACLHVGVRRFPAEDLRLRVFDLTAKARVHDDRFRREAALDLGRTTADVFVLVTPT